jgi:hypothetical protein
LSELSNTVIIQDINPSQALDFKYELIESGLVLDKDFSFYWRAPSIYLKGSVEFYFADPVHATFYTLKWL